MAPPHPGDILHCRGGTLTMASRKGRLSIRGPSSPDLGQERPNDRLRPGAVVDLGIRDDAITGVGSRPPVAALPRR
jgi:hypothetical protein